VLSLVQETSSWWCT